MFVRRTRTWLQGAWSAPGKQICAAFKQGDVWKAQELMDRNPNLPNQDWSALIYPSIHFQAMDCLSRCFAHVKADYHDLWDTLTMQDPSLLRLVVENTWAEDRHISFAFEDDNVDALSVALEVWNHTPVFADVLDASYAYAPMCFVELTKRYRCTAAEKTEIREFVARGVAPGRREEARAFLARRMGCP